MRLLAVIVLLSSNILLWSTVFAQDDSRHIPLPKHAVENVPRDDFSGRFDGTVSRPFESRFRSSVRHQNAPWLRLNFADYHLGDESYMIIRSVEDRAYQRLDAKSIEEWGNSSAFFNGDELGGQKRVS